MSKKKFSLTRTWQRVRTVPGLGRYSAALAVLVVGGLVAVGFLLGNLQFILPGEDRYVFSADFDKAPAVDPSQTPEVRIAGVPVGVVTGSKVTEDNNSRLTFSLEPDQVIYDNARIVLSPKNPLNLMYVNIDPGGPPGKPLKDGSVIPVTQTDRPIQPDEVLSHLDSRTRDSVANLLVTMDTALANAPKELPAGLGATNDAMAAFKPVLAKLEKRQESIRAVVSSLSQITAAVGDNNGRLSQLADSLEGTLKSLAKRDEALKATLAELPGTTDQLSGAMSSVRGLSGELSPALKKISDASGQLPETLDKLRGTLGAAQQTVDAAQPVVAKASPLLDQLGPVVGSARTSLTHLEPVTKRLDPITATVVPHLEDLAAFVYNTSSMVSLQDGQGNFFRGHVVAPLPAAGVLKGPEGGQPGPDAPTPKNGGGN